MLAEQGGVVFARPAIVHRGMYAGRGIIAPNTQSSNDTVDERGYLPVEWWIMSSTEAKNAVPVENEGACVVQHVHRAQPPTHTHLSIDSESNVG